MKKEKLAGCFFFLWSLVLISLTSQTPVPNGPPCSICKEWELTNSVKVEDKLTVLKYRSKRTGLTVVLGPAVSPVVNGYFCLATEAFDDDGLPHTLEHLIFRGSEDYAYKETLDKLASR